MSQRWMILGCLSALLSVAMGAFGAHALSSSLSPRSLSVYQTAAHYQMFHALALLALGLWCGQNAAASGTGVAGWAFTFGTLLFSGSLYALAITDIKILGAITPIGGLLFMIGWVAFAISAWKPGT